MVKSIFLMRHCLPKRHKLLEYNFDELSYEGFKQAERLVSTFNQEVDLVFSSPFKRCLSTAKYFSKKYMSPIKIDSLWREYNMGVFNTRHYQDFLDDWEKHNFDYNYYSEGAESVNQGRERIVIGFNRLIKFGKNSLCITHGALISNLLMMLYGCSFEDGKISEGKFVEIELDERNLILKNSTSPSLDSFCNSQISLDEFSKNWLYKKLQK